jgi:hypothetical protein
MCEKGIIYLIQPAELVGTERYKIGCSSKTSLERCQNGYKKGSRFLNIMECSDPFGLEKRLKDTFGRRFRLVAGKEYFEGDEEEIKREFYNVVCGIGCGGDGGAVVEEKEKKKRKPRKKKEEMEEADEPSWFSEPVPKKCIHRSLRVSSSTRWNFADMFQVTVHVKNEDVDMFKFCHEYSPGGYKLVSRWSHPRYYKFYLDCVKNFTQEEYDIITQYHIDCVDDFIGTDFEEKVTECYEYVKEEYRKNGVETEAGSINICLGGFILCILVLSDKSIKYIQSLGKCREFG